MRKFCRFLTVSAAIMAVSAPLAYMQLTNNAYATNLYLKGNIVYRERMALPPDSKVDVSLVDTTITDTSKQIVASSQFVATSSSPIPYELSFDNTKLQTDHNYVLQAKITVDGQVLFSAIGNQSVFTGAENDTQIFVSRAGSDKNNPNKQKLIGSYVIVNIEDKSPEGRVPLTIMFLEDGRASIYAGCNTMFADYKISSSKMSFSPLMATQMACSPTIMNQEKRVSAVINRVQKYQLTNNDLILMDIQNKNLLKLTRQDL